MKVGAEHPEFGKLCEVLQDIPRKGDVMALKEAIDPGNFLPRCNIPKFEEITLTIIFL